MSLADGMAALNLDMPERVPRFEPSAAEYHWDLVAAVTGLPVTQCSTEAEKLAARRKFLVDWDYGIYFGCLVGPSEFGKWVTHMGHAEYAKDGADFNNDIQSAFKDPEELLAFDPWEAFGEKDHAELVERFNRQYRRLCRAYPDTVNTTGVYVTQMSGIIMLAGWDMLLTAAGTDPKRFGELMNRYASWMQQYYDAMADCEAEVIYSHDDLVWSAGPFIHPDWYRTYIFPNLKKYWDPLRQAGKKTLFVCDGDYTRFAEDVAACGNHGFWFEIFTDLEYMTETFGKTHFIIGNADARILTFGSKQEIRAEVERCMSAGKKCPGYFMCVSGHIPANVPVDNAIYYNDVYMGLQRR